VWKEITDSMNATADGQIKIGRTNQWKFRLVFIFW